MWLIQNVVALLGAGLVVAGCVLLARRSTTAWANALVASTVAFLAVAVGAEFYLLHAGASAAFLDFMAEYQAPLVVTLFFVASLSFFMVSRKFQRPG